MNTNLPCLVAELDSGNGEVWLVYHRVDPRFNASDVHTAFGNTPGSAHKFVASAPALGNLRHDRAETRWYLPPQHTNAWPRRRRFLAIPAARKASTYYTRRRLHRTAGVAFVQDFAERI